MRGADWPYDADRDDPLTALRIPVTSAWPGFTYTAVLDRESEVRPSDHEARMIASFIEEYQTNWFGDGHWRKIQQAKPFDMDCYTTTVLHKWAENDWSFRQVRWPGWTPAAPRLRGTELDSPRYPGPMTLAEVMEAAHRAFPDRWSRWKSAHPDVFGTAR